MLRLVLNKLKQTWQWLRRVPFSPAAIHDGLVSSFPAGTRFRACPEVAAEALGDGLVLVHLTHGSTFRLNRTGKQVWELCRAGRTIAEIVVQLQTAWPGSAGRLEVDVGRVLADLVREQLLEAIAESAS